jgi:hypothetical protein
MVMPDDNISLEITLHTPVAIEKSLRFAIREGGRISGLCTGFLLNGVAWGTFVAEDAEVTIDIHPRLNDLRVKLRICLEGAYQFVVLS